MGQATVGHQCITLPLLLLVAAFSKICASPARSRNAQLTSSELYWHGETSQLSSSSTNGFLDWNREGTSQHASPHDSQPVQRGGISFLQTGARRSGKHRSSVATTRRLVRTAASKHSSSRKRVASLTASSMMQQASTYEKFAQLARSKQYRIQHLFDWMAMRNCNRICQSTDEADACHSDCKGSLTRLREASDQVRPAGIEEFIEFPTVPYSDIKLRSANDNTKYTGMMFVGSAKHRGNTTFVARLCTHGCNVSAPQFDSTLVLGELQQGTENHSSPTLRWQHLAEHWVPHNDGDMANRSYVGPEDPRMDVVKDRRFLTLTMNVDASQFGCKGGKKNRDVRHMFFVPVDPAPNFSMCDLRVDGVDRCHVQKNWASLVPRGSNDVYYVYSVKPLQMFRFSPGTCQTAWLELPHERDGHEHVPRPWSFDILYSVHGGTRYVFGGSVVDGDLYVSVGHTPAPEYRPVLVGILHRNRTEAEKKPEFQVVGVSCPMNISTSFGERLKPSDEDWEHRMLIATSIVDFDLENDISTVTFQVHDHENYQTRLLGVGRWLQSVYKEYANGITFSCHELH